MVKEPLRTQQLTHDDIRAADLALEVIGVIAAALREDRTATIKVAKLKVLS